MTCNEPLGLELEQTVPADEADEVAWTPLFGSNGITMEAEGNH
jgi:hypothetical protein